MSKKITVSSKENFLPITKAGTFSPKTPLFLFKNTGNTLMYVNGVRLQPGEVFGVDNSTFLAALLAQGFEPHISSDTNYNIYFGKTIADPRADIGDGDFGGAAHGAGVLITTEYFITK